MKGTQLKIHFEVINHDSISPGLYEDKQPATVSRTCRPIYNLARR